MPTSKGEAVQIVDIINDFVEFTAAKVMTKRLHEEIGQHTDNESLAVSLEMLKTLYDNRS